MTRIIAVALTLLTSQIVLSLIGAGLTQAAMQAVMDVIPFVALLVLPAALGFAVAPRLGRLEPTAESLAGVITIGLAMRFVWFATPAPFEDDFYRYQWDGAVVGAGFNPYKLTPEQVLQDPELPEAIVRLAAAGRSVLERINFPDLTSIYPGTAQIVFAVAQRFVPWNVDGLRLIFLLADAATLLILIALLRDLRRSPLWVALFWCNPLMVLATAATVHVDALLPPLVFGAFLAMHRCRPTLSLTLLALAAGVKIWPLLLAPLLMRGSLSDPRRLFLPVTAFVTIATATLLPLLAVSGSGHSGLNAYAVGWSNNNALFAWAIASLHWLWGEESQGAEQLLRLSLAGAGGLVAIALAMPPVKDLRDHLTRALAVTATLFYLSPAQFPWYALWFMPLAALLQCWPLLLASVTLPSYYLFFPLVAFLHAAPVWASLLWQGFAPRAATYIRSARA
jgi:alpha-1,6-mannosyltransferase